jgi:hypothetical protein
MSRSWHGAVIALLVVVGSAAGCSSVEIVRLQPDILHTPRGTEPLAGLQVTTMGFYFMTLGIPEADLDRAINELLIKEAKKIGADKLVGLRFDATPSHGIWFLTKLLWFRLATAWAIAVVAEPDDFDPDLAPTPMDEEGDADLIPSQPPTSGPTSGPTSAPARPTGAPAPTGGSRAPPPVP